MSAKLTHYLALHDFDGKVDNVKSYLFSCALDSLEGTTDVAQLQVIAKQLGIPYDPANDYIDVYKVDGASPVVSFDTGVNPKKAEPIPLQFGLRTGTQVMLQGGSGRGVNIAECDGYFTVDVAAPKGGSMAMQYFKLDHSPAASKVKAARPIDTDDLIMAYHRYFGTYCPEIKRVVNLHLRDQDGHFRRAKLYPNRAAHR